MDPGFPVERSANPPRGEEPTYDRFCRNFQKINVHEIEKILGRGGGVARETLADPSDVR